MLAKNDTVIELRQCTIDTVDRAQLPLADMLELISAGPEAINSIAQVVAEVNTGHHPLNDVVLHPPIPRPGKNIFCVGWNYLKHLKKLRERELPSHVTFFTKAPTAMNGPYAPTPMHAGVTEKLDWEAELAIVIGKRDFRVRRNEPRIRLLGGKRRLRA